MHTGVVNITLFAMLGPFVERHFTGRIFIKLVFFVNGLSFLLIYLAIIVWFAISDDLHEFYTAHCGFSASNAALLVVLKQKFPEESLLGVVKFKHLPVLSCCASLLLWLLLSHVLATQVPLVLFGTLWGWFYLRFINEDSVTGVAGDVHNDGMLFVTLFPDVPLVRYVVGKVSDVCFVCATWSGVFAAMDVFGWGPQSTAARGGLDLGRGEGRGSGGEEGVSLARAAGRKQTAMAAVELLVQQQEKV
jgi:hypothetical protein